jgi:hypothetical protein
MPIPKFSCSDAYFFSNSVAMAAVAYEFFHEEADDENVTDSDHAPGSRPPERCESESN